MRYRYSAEENGKLVKKAVVYTQDEHRINQADIDKEAVYIVERIKASGFEAYIVGGAVRDLLLGKKPKDFDIVTSAVPVRLKRIFRNSRIIGHRFRLVHVYFGPKIYEVATFRSMKDGPTSNTFGKIEDDVLRRDFTLNALFYDPVLELVIDYVGGMKDIHSKMIRPIIPLNSIFSDDPVRMIRAVKYGVCANFKLPMTLKMKIRKQSPLLERISPSRLTEELFKVINSPYAEGIVKGLDELGLYRYLQPAAAELFRTRPGFKEQYLRSLSASAQNESAAKPGETLSALVKDYLEEEANWDVETPIPPSERYRDAFALARKFVLPMNPPKLELDHAVRLIFSRHGIAVKRSRFDSRYKNRRKKTVNPAE